MSDITPFQRLLAIIYDCGGSARLRQYFEEIEKLIPQIQPNIKEKTIAHGCLLELANSRLIPDELLKDLLALLISKGADMYYKDTTGNLLHCLIRSNRFELFQVYVEKGVDVNTQAISGSTPLHTAVKENRPQFVEYLLNHPKVDLSLIDEGENTAQQLITDETDKAIENAFEEKENQQKLQKPQQTHGFFAATNAISTSREYPVSKTLAKRRQLEGYQRVSQDDEDEHALPEHDNNTQSSWFSHFLSKLIS